MIKRQDLIYLAGIFEFSDSSPFKYFNEDITIGNQKRASTWADEMVKCFGLGRARQRTTSRGKQHWGWDLTFEERLTLIKAMHKARVLRATDDITYEVIINKYTRAIETKHRAAVDTP